MLQITKNYCSFINKQSIQEILRTEAEIAHVHSLIFETESFPGMSIGEETQSFVFNMLHGHQASWKDLEIKGLRLSSIVMRHGARRPSGGEGSDTSQFSCNVCSLARD